MSNIELTLAEAQTIDVDIPENWEYYMMTSDSHGYTDEEYEKIAAFQRKHHILAGLSVLSRNAETIRMRCLLV
jgi:hypothetical protein